MPRTGGGTGPFVLNPVYLAVPGTTILATQHNTPLEDIEDTFNIPQPIAYGGTQAASAIEAMDNLFIVGADKASSASIDLNNVTGSFVNITGTTPVTSIALAEGAIRFARAVSALPITASASLIVNGSTTNSYICTPGDQLMIVGYASAIVRVWVQGMSRTTAVVSDIRGQIYGLTLSNNATDAVNDIDVAAGAAVDTTGAVSMLLASSMTKRLDATWVAGTNQGGRFVASISDDWFYVFLIRNPTSGIVDIGFSTNATNPTGDANYPAGFTQYRRIGSIRRAFGALLGFVQSLNRFQYKIPRNDYEAVIGTSALNATLQVPPITGIEAEILAQAPNSNTGAIAVYSKLIPDFTVDSAYNLSSSDIVAGNTTRQYKYVLTNDGGVRVAASVASQTLVIYTLGWNDYRDQ